jgi:hypothetical protein
MLAAAVVFGAEVAVVFVKMNKIFVTSKCSNCAKAIDHCCRRAVSALHRAGCSVTSLLPLRGMLHLPAEESSRCGNLLLRAARRFVFAALSFCVFQSYTKLYPSLSILVKKKKGNHKVFLGARHKTQIRRPKRNLIHEKRAHV